MTSRWIQAVNNKIWQFVPKATSTSDKIMTWAEQYAVLQAYYYNNALYDSLRATLGSYGYKDESIKGLRNPTFRVVEFYAAKLWPGVLPEALPIETENEDIVPLIEQIWKWSNWNIQMEQAAATFAINGDIFLKINTKSAPQGGIRSVYLESLNPSSVTEIATDERNFLTYVRLDVPIFDKSDNKTYIHTEEFDKETQLYRRWKHLFAATTPIDKLPTPTETKTFMQGWGADFIPIVWAGLRLRGGERGQAAITPAIDKIDEANRQATDLHKLMFRYNKPTMIVGRDGNDASGRPLPPVQLTDNKLTQTANPDEDNIWLLPGATTVASLIPPLAYADHLATINAMMDELTQDLPEMIYSQLHNTAVDLSGVAMDRLLLAASDRLMSARKSAESALQRAHEMALTIGVNARLFGDIGNFENGDFEHMFSKRPVWTQTELEIAQVMSAYTSASVPPSIAAKWAGLSEDKVKELDAAIKQEQAQEQATQLNGVSNTLNQLRGKATNGNGQGGQNGKVTNGVAVTNGSRN